MTIGQQIVYYAYLAFIGLGTVLTFQSVGRHRAPVTGGVAATVAVLGILQTLGLYYLSH